VAGAKVKRKTVIKTLEKIVAKVTVKN
jgi:hypothetical protein